MAVAYVQEFPIHMHQPTNYDIVMERLGIDTDPPQGRVIHTAGFDDAASVFRIFDVWETEEQGERFQTERVAPLVSEIFRSDPKASVPSREAWYHLHVVIHG